MHPRSTIRRAFAIAALVLAAGCESGTEPGREGVIEGTWAGARYDGVASASMKGDSLFIGGYSGNDQEWRWLSIAVGGVNGPGEYPIGAGGAEFRYGFSDIISATYAVTQPGAGRVVISSTSGALVVGHVRFDADVQRGHEPAGQRASFDGEFRAPIAAYQLPPFAD